MITKQILRQAKALIQNRDQWTQADGARNKLGNVVPPNSPEATCWCAYGAIAKVLDLPDWSDVIIPMIDLDLNKFNGQQLWAYNDSHTHIDVLAMFDDLIERAPA